MNRAAAAAAAGSRTKQARVQPQAAAAAAVAIKRPPTPSLERVVLAKHPLSGMQPFDVTAVMVDVDCTVGVLKAFLAFHVFSTKARMGCVRACVHKGVASALDCPVA